MNTHFNEFKGVVATRVFLCAPSKKKKDRIVIKDLMDDDEKVVIKKKKGIQHDATKYLEKKGLTVRGYAISHDINNPSYLITCIYSALSINKSS